MNVIFSSESWDFVKMIVEMSSGNTQKFLPATLGSPISPGKIKHFSECRRHIFPWEKFLAATKIQKSKILDQEAVFCTSIRFHSSKSRSCGLGWSFMKIKGASFWAMISNRSAKRTFSIRTFRKLNFCCRQKFLRWEFLAKWYPSKTLIFLGNEVILECC